MKKVGDSLFVVKNRYSANSNYLEQIPVEVEILKVGIKYYYAQIHNCKTKLPIPEKTQEKHNAYEVFYSLTHWQDHTKKVRLKRNILKKLPIGIERFSLEELNHLYSRLLYYGC